MLIDCDCFEKPEALSDQSLRKSFVPEDARAARQTESSWDGTYPLTEGGERDGVRDDVSLELEESVCSTVDRRPAIPVWISWTAFVLGY